MPEVGRRYFEAARPSQQSPTKGPTKTVHSGYRLVDRLTLFLDVFAFAEVGSHRSVQCRRGMPEREELSCLRAKPAALRAGGPVVTGEILSGDRVCDRLGLIEKIGDILNFSSPF